MYELSNNSLKINRQLLPSNEHRMKVKCKLVLAKKEEINSSTIDSILAWYANSLLHVPSRLHTHATG